MHGDVACSSLVEWKYRNPHRTETQRFSGLNAAAWYVSFFAGAIFASCIHTRSLSSQAHRPPQTINSTPCLDLTSSSSAPEICAVSLVKPPTLALHRLCSRCPLRTRPTSFGETRYTVKHVVSKQLPCVAASLARAYPSLSGFFVALCPLIVWFGTRKVWAGTASSRHADL
jgi:hypothetical protein